MDAISRVGVVAPPIFCRRIGVVASRAYGSSAAQVQYDEYDYEEDVNERRRDRRSTADSEGWFPRRGVQWVVMGDTGVKKNLYAERLSKLLEVPHISMGSLVRQELNPSSSLFKQIANAVNGGKLVPEDIIFGLLAKRLEEGYNRGETGFILDGIPRTRLQAEILDQMADVDLVVNLKSTEGNSVKKNLRTGMFSHCQEFHSMSHGRIPDALMHEQKAKLETYSEQIKPLEEYYKRRNILLYFQVTGAPAETWKGLLAALRLQHVDAVSSSQKLTA